MKDWDADLYRRFEKQRTQAAKDLINNLELSKPERVLDVGCGPGNSAASLARAFTDAQITGIDTSPAMLSQARLRLASAKFLLRDANDSLEDLGTFDLVFSNAVFQWLPGHPQLIRKLFGMVRQGGALAVQIPDVRSMAIQRAKSEALDMPGLRERFSGFFPFNMNDAEYYYSILSPLSSEFYLWETNYLHVLENHEAIVEWYSSAGFRPYHDKLSASETESFNERVLEAVKKHYTPLCDGRVMFPFKRLFFIAYNQSGGAST